MDLQDLKAQDAGQFPDGTTLSNLLNYLPN
jgi:hypothetical protein